MSFSRHGGNCFVTDIFPQDKVIKSNPEWDCIRKKKRT